MAPWMLPAARAALALALGLAITFTGGHTAEFGLVAFGVFAVATGLLVIGSTLGPAAPREARTAFRAHGAVSVVAMLAIANVCRTWSTPALTAPFVLVTWLLLLASHVFFNIEGTLWDSGLVTPLDPAYADPLQAGAFVQGVLLSISQVFLKGNGIAAVLLLAGLAVSSLSAAAWALVGAVVAVLTAHALGAESDLVSGGLMGFSPVLTAIALGATFHKPGARVALYALAGTVFTVLVQGALNVVMMPFAIPSLTAPFVLVTWLFLLGWAKVE